MRIIYEANDGAQFDNKNECIEYENNSRDYKHAKEALAAIQEICDKHNRCRGYCPFMCENNKCTFGIGLPTEFINNIEGL